MEYIKSSLPLQRKEETAAKALVRFDPYPAPMDIDDMLADTEAIACAGIFIHTVQLTEWFKYHLMILGVYTDTVVLDAETPVLAIAGG